jgi:hypothetical protein
MARSLNGMLFSKKWITQWALAWNAIAKTMPACSAITATTLDDRVSTGKVVVHSILTTDLKVVRNLDGKEE